MTWAVEDNKGNTHAEFSTEDEAWSFIMRREVNHVPGADTLELREIIEDEDALIADLLGQA